jgi:hypothetical protein
MSGIGDGPPPSPKLTIGKGNNGNIPVPMTYEDTAKAIQIQKHFRHIQAKPWYNDFLMRYPLMQEISSEFFRMVDGMAEIGTVLQKDFQDAIDQARERQRLTANSGKVIQ